MSTCSKSIKYLGVYLGSSSAGLHQSLLIRSDILSSSAVFINRYQPWKKTSTPRQVIKTGTYGTRGSRAERRADSNDGCTAVARFALHATPHHLTAALERASCTATRGCRAVVAVIAASRYSYLEGIIANGMESTARHTGLPLLSRGHLLPRGDNCKRNGEYCTPHRVTTALERAFCTATRGCRAVVAVIAASRYSYLEGIIANGMESTARHIGIPLLSRGHLLPRGDNCKRNGEYCTPHRVTTALERASCTATRGCRAVVAVIAASRYSYLEGIIANGIESTARHTGLPLLSRGHFLPRGDNCKRNGEYCTPHRVTTALERASCTATRGCRAVVAVIAASRYSYLEGIIANGMESTARHTGLPLLSRGHLLPRGDNCKRNGEYCTPHRVTTALERAFCTATRGCRAVVAVIAASRYSYLEGIIANGMESTARHTGLPLLSRGHFLPRGDNCKRNGEYCTPHRVTTALERAFCTATRGCRAVVAVIAASRYSYLEGIIANGMESTARHTGLPLLSRGHFLPRGDNCKRNGEYCTPHRVTTALERAFCTATRGCRAVVAVIAASRYSYLEGIIANGMESTARHTGLPLLSRGHFLPRGDNCKRNGEYCTPHRVTTALERAFCTATRGCRAVVAVIAASRYSYLEGIIANGMESTARHTGLPLLSRGHFLPRGDNCKRNGEYCTPHRVTTALERAFCTATRGCRAVVAVIAASRYSYLEGIIANGMESTARHTGLPLLSRGHFLPRGDNCKRNGEYCTPHRVTTALERAFCTATRGCRAVVAVIAASRYSYLEGIIANGMESTARHTGLPLLSRGHLLPRGDNCKRNGEYCTPHRVTTALERAFCTVTRGCRAVVAVIAASRYSYLEGIIANGMESTARHTGFYCSREGILYCNERLQSCCRSHCCFKIQLPRGDNCKRNGEYCTPHRLTTALERASCTATRGCRAVVAVIAASRYSYHDGIIANGMERDY
ncbi:unnamed protein product [Nezara viridula]|uniref:Uncharacterized protein n=1 Tax=Nezara viridula TaxID=85310 RepID=A0A9P0HF86_NEZVI|nr:unnamed protein product [Nezara viridula]